MSLVNNAQALRQWLRQCPALQPTNRFHVDYIAEEPTDYALIATPSTIRYRENVLGEHVPADIQTINYIFASREIYGADEAQNLANLEFYQDVVQWVADQNDLRNFPRIEGGDVQAVRPTLTAYAAAPGVDTARYQIQIEITYKINR